MAQEVEAGPLTAATTFADRVAEAVDAKRSQLLVGLDPRADLLPVADGKRSDIGSTARAYADAYLERRGDGFPLVDALTVNPYLGSDSIEPFIAACRRSGAGLFCLVKTSNAGSADLQDLALSDGRPLWQ